MLFLCREYLISWIGPKTVSKYGFFQFGFIESVTEGIKYKVYLPKQFTDVPEELRGTIVPPFEFTTSHTSTVSIRR
jgi:hypothetical protein